MKTSLLIFVALTMSVFVTAQEKVKQREVGLVLSSLNNFGLTFKTGSSKSLWRFHSLLVSGGNWDETSDSLDRKESMMGINVQFGNEYRKVLVENLEFRVGADLSFRFSKFKTDYNDKTITNYDRVSERKIYEPGINLVLGLNYVVKNKLVIGAEFLPSVTYRTGKSKEKFYYNNYESEGDISGFSYGLNNNFVFVSLSYRFSPSKEQ